MAGADSTTYRRFTAGAAVVSLLSGVVASLLLIPVSAADPERSWGDMVAEGLPWGVMMIAAAVIGALLARNQPTNPLGWWLSAGGAVGSMYPALDTYANVTLETDPGAGPGGTIALLLSSVALYASWAILGSHVALRFPTGQLLSRRWRWPAHFATASVVMVSLEIFDPRAFDDDAIFKDLPGVSNPIGIPGVGAVAKLAFAIGIYLIFAMTFIGVGSLVARARRSHGIEKLQVRWVAFGALSVAVVGMATANAANAVEDPWRGVLLAASGFVPLLLMGSIGIAVLRHQLFDINVIIRRTVLYALLASFIAVTYIAVAVGVGNLVGRGGETDVPVSIVARRSKTRASTRRRRRSMSTSAMTPAP